MPPFFLTFDGFLFYAKCILNYVYPVNYYAFCFDLKCNTITLSNTLWMLQIRSSSYVWKIKIHLKLQKGCAITEMS